MKRRIQFFSIACVLGAAGNLCAAENEAAVDSTRFVNLKEVSVTALRATSKTPVAFTNLSGADIATRNNGQDLSYLLVGTPSLIVTSDAGTGIGYTSLRVRGTDGSRINVTANGIPINDAESHNVYWVDIPDVVSSVRDIQIQRGVGTSTNGAGAFGGSINLVLNPNTTAPSAEFNASYGMYNTHKESVAVSSGLLNDHWTIDARLTDIGTDGYIDRASTRLFSYFGQVGYRSDYTNLRFLSFGGTEKTYMAWDYASKEEMEEYGRRYNPCGKYTDSDGNKTFYSDQTDNYKQYNFQLILDQAINPWLKLNAGLHYTKGEGYYTQYKTNRTLAEYGLTPFINSDGEKVKKSDLIRNKALDNDLGGGIFSLTYHKDKATMILGGAANKYSGWHYGEVAWVRNYVGSLNPDQEYYRNKGVKSDVNIYLRGQYDIMSNLSAYADLQYRHIDYKIYGSSDTYDYNTSAMEDLNYHNKYDFFNPKVGLNYAFAAGQNVYASVSVAHKEPTRDNYVDSDADHQPKAEKLVDYELGYSFKRSIFNFGINLYYMDYTDQLVLTGQLSDTGNAMSVNVPDSYRAGVELQLGVRPVKWLNWTANATLSRNRIKNFVEYIYEDEWTNPISIEHGSTPIAFSPDFIFNNSFEFKFGGFDALLQSQYVSRQYMSNAHSSEQMLSSYFVTNLHAGYTFTNLLGIKSLRIGASVNNLFSAKYENNGYAGAGYYVDDNGEKVIYRYAGYAAQAPINILGTLSVKF